MTGNAHRRDARERQKATGEAYTRARRQVDMGDGSGAAGGEVLDLDELIDPANADEIVEAYFTASENFKQEFRAIIGEATDSGAATGLLRASDRLADMLNVLLDRWYVWLAPTVQFATILLEAELMPEDPSDYWLEPDLWDPEHEIWVAAGRPFPDANPSAWEVFVQVATKWEDMRRRGAETPVLDELIEEARQPTPKPVSG